MKGVQFVTVLMTGAALKNVWSTLVTPNKSSSLNANCTVASFRHVLSFQYNLQIVLYWTFAQPWPKFVILLLHAWPNGCERVAVHTERRSSKSRSRNVYKQILTLKRHDFIFKLMLSLSAQLNKWVWLINQIKKSSFHNATIAQHWL